MIIVSIDGATLKKSRPDPDNEEPFLRSLKSDFFGKTFASSLKSDPLFKWACVAALFKAGFTFPIRKAEDNLHGYNLDISEWFFSLLNSAQGAIFRKPVSGMFGAGLNVLILGMAIPANVLNHEDVVTWIVGMLSGVSGLAMGVGAGWTIFPALVGGYIGSFLTCGTVGGIVFGSNLTREHRLFRLINLGGK
jgi:hypothetical protein